MKLPDIISATASFSECKLYRYTLTRRWREGALLAFIGLNPSTADESVDDPTIRRCQGFAHEFGYAGIVMLNLFGIRATDPRVMLRHAEPIGLGNDEALLHWRYNCPVMVACWGDHGQHRFRAKRVADMLAPLHCLGETLRGAPRHPLYLKKTASLRLWR